MDSLNTSAKYGNSKKLDTRTECGNLQNCLKHYLLQSALHFIFILPPSYKCELQRLVRHVRRRYAICQLAISPGHVVSSEYLKYLLSISLSTSNTIEISRSVDKSGDRRTVSFIFCFRCTELEMEYIFSDFL